MKFFLTQKAHFSGVKEPSAEAAFMIKVTSKGIQPVDSTLGEGETEPCTTLRQHLQNAGSLPGYLICELKNVSNDVICFRILSSPLINSLIELFGEDVAIQVTISNLETQKYTYHSETFESSEMKITRGKPYAFQDLELFERTLFGDAFSNDGRLEISGNLTITVSVGIPPGPVVTDKMEVNRKMLLGEIRSDVVIIPENGKEVKAHTPVLAAHSDVFSAMFQSDMQEARTSTVEMPDMSEEGVRGLLAYLYCWETTEPNSKPNVALEMLQAGHKYDLPVLETAMKKLMLGKPNKWFDADVTLKLFFFAKKLPAEDGTCLKIKALRVMKGNFGDFKKSESFITLFKEDPETAMELSAYFAA